MMRTRSVENTIRIAVLAAGDAAIACASLAIAVLVRRSVELPWTRSLLPATKFPLGAGALAIFTASLLIALSATGFHSQSTSSRHRPTLLLAIPLQLAILGVIAVLSERPWPRSIFVIAPLLESVLLTSWRWLLRRLWPLRRRSVVVLGRAAGLQAFVSAVARHPEERITIDGLVSVDEAIDHAGYLGRFADPAAIEALRQATEVIDLADDGDEHRRLKLLALRGPRGFLFVPGAGDSLLVATRFGMVAGRLLAEVRVHAAYGAGPRIKRAFDLIAGSLLLLLAFPLFLVIAALIALDSGRPVLIRQERLGRGGTTFRIWKFRTMRNGLDATERTTLATDNDPRVTATGRMLRRYRLDELPQLLNVLAGSMSLVGPRPEIPEVSRRIEETLPDFSLRLMVLPGIAGLAQVAGEYDQIPATKLGYDLQYLCSWSPLLDIRILALAVTASLSGRGL
jgi:exopolysaccharide biosynthesis polyprenyl glycosylphosphotransferase